MSDLNKVLLIGRNVYSNPSEEIRDGAPFCKLAVDVKLADKVERHYVEIRNPKLVTTCCTHLQGGQPIYVEGSLIPGGNVLAHHIHYLSRTPGSVVPT